MAFESSIKLVNFGNLLDDRDSNTSSFSQPQELIPGPTLPLLFLSRNRHIDILTVFLSKVMNHISTKDIFCTTGPRFFSFDILVTDIFSPSHINILCKLGNTSYLALTAAASIFLHERSHIGRAASQIPELEAVIKYIQRKPPLTLWWWCTESFIRYSFSKIANMAAVTPSDKQQEGT